MPETQNTKPRARKKPSTAQVKGLKVINLPGILDRVNEDFADGGLRGVFHLSKQKFIINAQLRAERDLTEEEIEKAGKYWSDRRAAARTNLFDNWGKGRYSSDYCTRMAFGMLGLSLEE